MSRKKVLNKNTKHLYFVLLFLLFILIILMCILLTKKLFFNKSDYYKLVSRVNNISESKDTGDYSTVGWLKIQGTNIDYPVIFSKTDDYEYPFTLESYAWPTSSDGKLHNITQIDGHNWMNLGSNITKHSDDFKRFEELMDFVYFDFAKENLYFQYTTDGKDYLYKIFSTTFVTSRESSLYLDDGYDDKDELLDHISDLKEFSIYDYDVDVNEYDSVISLRTCSKFFGNEEEVYDFIVSGRLVREDEKIDSYSVRRNKNYESVYEILKGDDINDTEENI